VVRPRELIVYKAAGGFNMLRPRLDRVAEQRGTELLEARRRVRGAS
jgi:hypothetical protein